MSEKEQAAAVFEEVAKAFNLPKYPEDITEEQYSHFIELGIEEPRSVFEEASIIRYLEPEDDLRGIMMLALYNVHHGIQMPVEECAKKHFGGKRKIPKDYMLCFIGEGINGRLHFLRQGESWTIVGGRSAIRVNR